VSVSPTCKISMNKQMSVQSINANGSGGFKVGGPEARRKKGGPYDDVIHTQPTVISTFDQA